MTKCFVAASLLFLGLNAFALEVDWLLAYENRSTNDVMLDRRFERLLNTRVPARLSGQLYRALFGPPDPVVVSQGRYVSISACLQHGCSQKGFFWIDTQSGIGLGAQVVLNSFVLPTEADELTLASNGLSGRQIPAEAMRALLDWLAEEQVLSKSVIFIGRDGGSLTLDASAFEPRLPYQPSPGGPAFDCTQSSGPIERAICQDAELSLADLKMADLFRTIKHAGSTVPDYLQTQQMHDSWRERRDQECLAAADVKACLLEQYQAHTRALREGIPPR